MEEYDQNKVEIADGASEKPLRPVQGEKNVVGTNLNGSASTADCYIDPIDYDDVIRIRASITEQLEPRTERESKNKSSTKSRVALLHSETYTRILHDAMKHIHQDRDLLLESLLYYCGFLRNTPKFLSVVPPKKATRKHIERFHQKHYLDLIAPHSKQYQHDDDIFNDDDTETDSWIPTSSLPHELLDSMGLVEDCALPATDEARRDLWTYCQYVAGASLQAAHLLATNKADVAINWGGGRHHAHDDKAGGFCFVNDIVLAIQYLQKYHQRILYMDLDIHHCDGVQRAFYDTGTVLTMSFHRHEPGFFPSTSGSIREKGQHDTSGVGHNLNVPLPKSCTDRDFASIFQEALTGLFDAYDPQAVVLCLGADGLQGDPLVGERDGWNLSPECLAECVRLTSMLCGEDNASSTSGEKENKTISTESKHVESANITSTKDSNNHETHRAKRKLLVLGGGGYNPANTARTFLLGTAAACEGARPGMLWGELPVEVPRHEYFPRYGPSFELYSANWKLGDSAMSPTRRDGRYRALLNEAKKALRVGIMYLQSQRKANENIPDFSAVCFDDDFSSMTIKPKKSKAAAFSKTGVVLSSSKSSNDGADTDSGVVVTKQPAKKRKRRKRKHATKQPEKINSAS